MTRWVSAIKLWVANLFPGTSFRNVEGKLKLYIQASDFILTFLAFGTILWTKLEPTKYFSNTSDLFVGRNWVNYLSEKGSITILSICIVYIFYASRHSAKVELDIASKLFSRSRTPQEWSNVEGRHAVTPMIIAFFVLFLVLAWFVDDMRVFSLAIAGVYLINFGTQIIFRKNIKRYFSDPKFVPSNGDEHKAFILQRREVAMEYLFEKPHPLKELAVAFAGILAFLITISDTVIQVRVPNSVPYLIMIVALFLNEIIVTKWRRERNSKLARIDEDEAQDDRRRIGEQPLDT